MIDFKKRSIITFLIGVMLFLSIQVLADTNVLVKQFVFNGTTANDNFGLTVVNIGDYNNDGYDDVAVGSPFAEVPDGDEITKSNAGQVLIFFGNKYGSQYLESHHANITINGTEVGELLANGQQMLTSGDINNDSYSDLIIASPLIDSNSTLIDVGMIMVFYGTDNIVSQMSFVDANITINRTTATGNITSISSSFDFNADNYTDIIIGTSENPAGTSSASGAAYLFYGSAVGKMHLETSNANITIQGEHNNDNCGQSVAGIKNFNNDSYGDIAIAAHRLDGSGAAGAGAVFIYFGTAMNGITLNCSDANITLQGSEGGMLFGNSISFAGDFNNDTYYDIIIGAPSSTAAGIATAGQTFVFYGSGVSNATLYDYQANITINGTVASDQIGSIVAYGKDIDNDTHNDIIIGAPLANPSSGGDDAGQVFVFFGESIDDTDYSVSDANFTINGSVASQQLGYAVASAGDFNNDDYSQILIGSPYASAKGISNAGQAYIYGFDFDHPNVSLLSPINDSQVEQLSLSFRFNVSDFYSTIANCTLIINSQNTITKTTELARETELEIAYALPHQGRFNWTVNCTDISNNIGATGMFNLSTNIPSSGGSRTKRIYPPHQPLLPKPKPPAQTVQIPEPTVKVLPPTKNFDFREKENSIQIKLTKNMDALINFEIADNIKKPIIKLIMGIENYNTQPPIIKKEKTNYWRFVILSLSLIWVYLLFQNRGGYVKEIKHFYRKRN